jgi:uncharacterized DUF497 family protein
MGVEITFDPVKRDKVLAERGLDFALAGQVFAARTATIEDLRKAYPEPRFITAGVLNARIVVIVWTPTV